MRPVLQRVVAAGLDKPLEVPVADRVPVEEKGADFGVGSWAVPIANPRAPVRNTRTLAIRLRRDIVGMAQDQG